MLKKGLKKMKNSLWISPALYSSLGLAFAILTITLDMNYNDYYIYYVPEIFLTSVDLSIKILATLSSALITMTTFTFSMIMVVLTTYYSQFSPRALPNFMTQKTTMRVLGIFLGGFIYAIYSLLFMRKSMENEYVISAVIAVLITIICLLYFIYFIHFIARSIQVDYLIEKISEDTFKSSRELKDKIRKNHVLVVNDSLSSYSSKHSYYSKSTSYIQTIDTKELLSLASSKNIFIKVHYKIGEFISENICLFSIHSDEDDLEEGLLQECAEHIALGNKRNASQDLTFSLQQLVEIALRATSPAINDPYTAKHCIRNIGKVLAESTSFLNGDLLYKDQEGRERLLIPMENMKNLLYYTFYQFEIQNRKDITILGAIIDALIMTAQKSSNEIKPILWGFLEYKAHPFETQCDLHEFDKEYLEIKKRKLFEVTH